MSVYLYCTKKDCSGVLNRPTISDIRFHHFYCSDCGKNYYDIYKEDMMECVLVDMSEKIDLLQNQMAAISLNTLSNREIDDEY
jgi:hypothetical protein